MCLILTESAMFLGLTSIRLDCTQPIHQIAAIHDVSQLTYTSELKYFLGMINNYAEFFNRLPMESALFIYLLYTPPTPPESIMFLDMMDDILVTASIRT